MKKELSKILLAVTMLFLCGVAQLSAHTVSANVSDHSISLSQSDEPAGNIHESQAMLSAATSKRQGNSEEPLIIEETEMEEDDKHSAKRYLESIFYFSIILFSLILGFNFLNNKSAYIGERLSYINYFRWYIVFQVFRI
ncbi:hypothetical protein [Roseivirga pacifica]|uniref:hypothetical protein n=1 Tax=Roseivirga pacifica TaxID=1267423 RepID=UPI0020962E5A|nr:hypothetical protein [Roseivirga pacifica]MCO6357530.1 hypothetical protein [Roseivirga pacifica]MCO6367705.1 hypothetical protein [Roseivirga pacifica]MCO6369763.1 hypothetical protein [Roseivirga pacifica]MCO6373617.1 hypothetical protein [Roseivirga pacifica]MCO6377078.1 hypothetical protein [Roseivirga pacifica]